MLILKKIVYYLFATFIGFLFFFVVGVSRASAQTSTPPPSCSQVGFIPCVKEKFETKFPFDLFKGVSSLATSTTACPKITLMYSDWDICFLLDFVKVAKFPIAVGLLVRLYIYA